MNSDFNGKSVLVTGATSGIGRAVASKFAQTGAFVTAVGRNEAVLEDLMSELNQDGNRTITVVADVTQVKDVQRAVESAANTFGRLDVLVNAAGHISSGTIENTSIE